MKTKLLRIDDDLFARLKQSADKKGMNMASLMMRFLVEALVREEK